MSVTNHSSAGRLWNVLFQAKNVAQQQIYECEHRVQNPDSGLPPVEQPTVKSVFISVLNLSQSGYNDFQKISILFDLMSDVEHDLRILHRNDTSIYFAPISRLRQALLTIGIEESWEKFEPYLDDLTLSGLASIAHSIDSNFNEDEIEDADLRDLSSKIYSLIDLLITSSINQNLKTVLINSLQQLMIAIADYRITGTSGFKTAAQSAATAVVLSKADVENDDEMQKVKDVFAVVEMALKLVGWSCKAYNAFAPVLGSAPIPLP